MARPVKEAMSQVETAAEFYRRLGEQIKKYGVRVTFVQMFPKPVIDFTIKDRK